MKVGEQVQLNLQYKKFFSKNYPHRKCWVQESYYMRSVYKYSKQFKQTVFSLILELLGFVPFEIFSSTFNTFLAEFLPVLNHSWNASFGILHSSASKFSLISLANSNRCPFCTDFSLVKRKKSARARSGEHGGWGTSVVSCFARMHKSIVMMVQPFLSPLQIMPFSLQCLSKPVHHLQIIFLVHCLAMRYKFMMNYGLTIKKHIQHHFHIGPNLPCNFGPG